MDYTTRYLSTTQQKRKKYRKRQYIRYLSDCHRNLIIKKDGPILILLKKSNKKSFNTSNKY